VVFLSEGLTHIVRKCAEAYSPSERLSFGKEMFVVDRSRPEFCGGSFRPPARVCSVDG